MAGRTKKAPGAPVAGKKVLPVKKAVAKKAAPRPKKKAAPVREKNLGGRPPEWNYDDLCTKLNKYINDNCSGALFPILEEFCSTTQHPQHKDRWLPVSTLKSAADKHEGLSSAIKRCSSAKEARLQRGMGNGLIPPGFGNFALKQLGWKDTQEVEVTHGTRIVRLPAKKPIGDGS